MALTGKVAAAVLFSAFTSTAVLAQSGTLLTGQSAFTDYSKEQPGVRHKITVADLPAPDPAEAVDNGPDVVPRPANAWPVAPAGFKVTLYAGGDATPMQRSDNKKQTYQAATGTFTMPRLIRFAPNGDLFLADSQAGILFVLRGLGPDGKAHSKIDPLRRYVYHGVGQQGFNRNIGIGLHEGAQPRGQPVRSERGRRGNPNKAARPCKSVACLLSRCLQLTNQRSRAFKIDRPRLGEVEPPGRAIEHSKAKLSFERGDGARDDRGIHTALACDGSE